MESNTKSAASILLNLSLTDASDFFEWVAVSIFVFEAVTNFTSTRLTLPKDVQVQTI